MTHPVNAQHLPAKCHHREHMKMMKSGLTIDSAILSRDTGSECLIFSAPFDTYAQCFWTAPLTHFQRIQRPHYHSRDSVQCGHWAVGILLVPSQQFMQTERSLHMRAIAVPNQPAAGETTTYSLFDTPPPPRRHSMASAQTAYLQILADNIHVHRLTYRQAETLRHSGAGVSLGRSVTLNVS